MGLGVPFRGHSQSPLKGSAIAEFLGRNLLQEFPPSTKLYEAVVSSCPQDLATSLSRKSITESKGCIVESEPYGK